VELLGTLSAAGGAPPVPPPLVSGTLESTPAFEAGELPLATATAAAATAAAAAAC